MSVQPFPRVRATLRIKFLLALTVISALLTSAVLLIVQYRVRVHAREEIAQSLGNSMVAFQSLQQQRGATLERTVELLATLPPLRAAMTSEDPATIQDASKPFWEMAGSQVLALADRTGRLVAFHTTAANFDRGTADASLRRALGAGQSSDWWFGGGHLFEVFVEPIYFGAPDPNHVLGMLAVGYEIDSGVAADVTRAAASEIAFGYDGQVIISTVPEARRGALAEYVRHDGPTPGVREVRLGGERFLAESVRLSGDRGPVVTVVFLKSFDEATAFLRNLNRWIAIVGAGAVLLGAVLVFVVSTTFTWPLARLVSGVRALEQGDYEYPLEVRGRDEVSTLTEAFARMRATLRDAQRKLLEAEQLATIGRMASTISHDLRHPLTAVLAYAEFLSEHDLTDAQRKDFFQEIRIAVNRMLDEINSLLGFSKEREAAHPVHAQVDDVIDRSVKAIKALPEFAGITITVTAQSECVGWFDPAKLERVMLNLLMNAAEVVSPDSGRIEVSCHTTADGTEIRVADNGPGIPDPIAGSLFQPFVSHGKEKGIGLGLTIVQNIMQQHHGEVRVECTGSSGTVFRLFFPARSGAPAPSGAAV